MRRMEKWEKMEVEIKTLIPFSSVYRVLSFLYNEQKKWSISSLITDRIEIVNEIIFFAVLCTVFSLSFFSTAAINFLKKFWTLKTKETSKEMSFMPYAVHEYTFAFFPLTLERVWMEFFFSKLRSRVNFVFAIWLNATSNKSVTRLL